MKTSSEFKQDFELYAASIRRDWAESEDGIEEIRQAIRDDWKDAEKRELWIKFIADWAAFERRLVKMGQGIAERIKAAKEKDPEGFEERAAIVEFDGKKPTSVAELIAAKEIEKRTRYK